MAKTIYNCSNCGQRTVTKSFNWFVCLIWFVLFFPIGIIYAITRLKKPVCKNCGVAL